MKAHLQMIASFCAFALLTSCGDRKNTSALEDATPPPEIKRIVSVLQSNE